MLMISGRRGNRGLAQRRLGRVVVAAFCAALPLRTVTAQPVADRSLNAVKPVTESNPVPPTPSATTLTADLSVLTRPELEAKIRGLSDELAAANAEGELFRHQWQELRLRDEALGVEALTVDQRKLEEKLVQAVKELYQSEMRRREAIQALSRLLNSSTAVVNTAPKVDPQVRVDYEVACRSAREFLEGRDSSLIALGTSLTDGRIADVNAQLNAVVVNLGKNQGVKEGMSFLIFHANRQVGTARIVLARDVFSAALLEGLAPNVALQVGDRVALNAGP